MSKDFGLLQHVGGTPGQLLPRAAGERPLIEAAPSDRMQRDKTLLDYCRILLCRWKVIATCVVVVVAGVGLISMKMPKIYRAEGRISVTRENPDTLGFSDAAVPNTEDPDVILALDTQVDILESDSLALATMEKVGWANNSAMKAPENGASGQEDLLRRFKRNLEVSRMPRSRMILIRFYSSDPRMAASVVNSLIDLHLESNFRSKFQATTQASQWLAGQLEVLKAKVESSQAVLVNYQKQHGIVGLDEKQNIVTSKLDELNKDVTQAQADRIQKEANHRLAQSENPELLAGADPNTLIQKLRAQQSDLRMQYAQATASMGPKHPKVIELSEQMKQLDATILAEVRNIAGRYQSEYMAALHREYMLRQALAEQKRAAGSLNQSAIKYTILKRDYEANRQLYEGLLQKYKEATISAGLRADNIRIVDPARLPEKPIKPDILQNIGVAFLMSLMGGIVLALSLEKLAERELQERVCTPYQVHAFSGLQAFGLIPQLRLPNKHPSAVYGNGNGLQPALAAFCRPRSQIAESYRALRTSLLFSALDSESKMILVTSALPGEGKTTTSLNLATVLAQKGSRVLLVDADFRHPELHTILGISDPHLGLASSLTGSHSIEKAVLATPQTGLYVLPAGPWPAQATELLGSEVMINLCVQFREQFDHIVLDSPPVLAVTDPVLLATQADSVLLVVRMNRTPIDALVSATTQLLQGKPRRVGVVINAVDMRFPAYHYYITACGDVSYGAPDKGAA